MIVTCDSSPTTTVISGAPNSPRSSTDQPASASTRCRAAARAVKFAIVAPVVNPADVPAGSPNRSTSQPSTTSSTTAAAGDMTYIATFWSHVLVSQSAPSAAGCAPPMTKPKYRGPAVATRPGSAAAASVSTVSAASAPAARSGPPSAERSEARSTVGATGRSPTPAR